jgi:V/A-type H+-transporting ATPase subunit D
MEVAFEKPIPSRLTLIRLKNQEKLYRGIKKTVEDARNATIQRIRSIIPRLQELRRKVIEELGETSTSLRIASSRLSIEELGKLAKSVKPTVEVEFVERNMEGARFSGIELRGFTSPNYSIYGIPPELDSAIHSIYSRIGDMVEVINLETLFYTLLSRVREYQRMVNAIDNVMLPRIINFAKNVRLALDEEEREEFVRRIVTSRILTAQ